MGEHLGDFRLDVDSVIFYAQTSTPATGAETDADAVPSYRIYRNEVALPVVTGNMALLDDANTVGQYSEAVAVSTGNGFVVGDMCCIRVRALMAAVPGADDKTFRVVVRRTDDLAVPGSAMTLAAGAIAAATFAAGAINAAAIATDAIDADALAADADTEIATAVWAYSPRTLTSTAAATTAAVAGSVITIHRGDNLSASLTGLGNIAARTKLWFTVKTSLDDADTVSIIQIEETLGLVYLNAAAAGVPANGDITIDNAALGNITITLDEVETAKLAYSDNLYYDVQMLTATGVTTLTNGQCDITRDVTRATA